MSNIFIEINKLPAIYTQTQVNNRYYLLRIITVRNQILRSPSVDDSFIYRLYN